MYEIIFELTWVWQLSVPIEIATQYKLLSKIGAKLTRHVSQWQLYYIINKKEGHSTLRANTFNEKKTKRKKITKFNKLHSIGS